MQYSIDVIIPSFRLDEEILIRIFNLKKPANVDINFFLIADNPAITVSDSIMEMVNSNKVNLLINAINLGFSKTRNKGIEAGSGDWILFLDDDIVPEENLLISYAEAIKNHPESLGFIGITHFPQPFNTITKALALNGSVSHFKSGLDQEELSWAPTANVMFNRSLLGNRRFLPQLVNGGEDIELLFRNSLENNKKYRAVPDAMVTHPWWNDGKIQTRRMFRYGLGASEIVDIPHIKLYSYRDFTNTSETLFILILSALLALLFNGNIYWICTLAFIIIISEFLTNMIRSIAFSKSFSIPLAWQMIWHKNAYEAGFLWGCLSHGRLLNIGKRIDVGFNKPNPSPFRLNKWKIIKMSLVLILGFLLFCF